MIERKKFELFWFVNKQARKTQEMQYPVQLWFQKFFFDKDMNLRNEKDHDLPLKTDNGQLKAIIEINPATWDNCSQFEANWKG